MNNAETVKNLNHLVEMSNRYGSDPDYVIAGGGNTSYKDGETLYIKGSGTSLALVRAEDFVMMDRSALDAILEAQYAGDDDAREAEVLAALLAARLPASYGKRPSVETLLHHLFPHRFVLHTHPALVNGLSSSLGAKAACARLFGDAAVFCPPEKPGFSLAAACRALLDANKAKTGSVPQILFLENHGVFVAADTVDEIDAMMAGILAKIRAELVETPDFTEAQADTDRLVALAPAVRMLFDAEHGASVLTETGKSAMAMLESEGAFAPLTAAPTPDHMVYCHESALFIPYAEELDAQYALLKERFDAYVAQNGFAPVLVGVEKTGFFIAGSDRMAAVSAKELLRDWISIAVYAKSFGGYDPLNEELRRFIANWEAENYRRRAAATGVNGRIAGKIAVVTGSAQGFGRGIALAMAEEGAHLVIADMNEEGAKACAADLNERYGAGTAIAVAANVSDEESVRRMIDATVLAFGGLDVFVNNAGIVRAGSLDEMTLKNFELVTAVNYTAYFLCAKYASKIMKIQHRFAPDYMMDIIEINSKSGLAGSNKNFAYAGSKFGGIGLTQSFALELAPYQVKVNAICPGNLLDGPLWSDPEKGLFVQYLNAGKVPGAKTVADVKRFYEAKVPMNRGCREADVACAILYVIEQKYETGQAIPVTGGQEMLN